MIEHDGRKIGYVQTELRDEPPQLYVLNLAIVPEYQGRGIGSRVMACLMQRGADSGRPVRLNVFAENEGALRFCRRLGFDTEGTSDHGLTLGWSGGAPPAQKPGEEGGRSDPGRRPA